MVFAAAFFYPILCEYRYLGPGLHGWLNSAPNFARLDQLPINNDSDLFAELRWVPYYTLAHFHQWPFWNPYKCGGMSMLGNPESGIVTPFLVLYLAGGLVAGFLLEIYLHLAIAFAGGYVLGRELGMRPIACTVLAAMFPSSSWLPLHVAVGHLNFLPAAYFPWILAMLFAACRLRRWLPAAIGGLFCAMTLTQGNYTFVYAAMIVAIVAVTLAVLELSSRPIAAAVVIGIFALGFGALKIIPVGEILRLHPRPDFGASYVTWPGAMIALFSRNQDVYRETVGSFYFCEYGGYLGAPFVILALIGMAAASRRAIPWVIAVVVFFLLFRGDTGPNALITYVRKIPFGRDMGLCGRWVIPLTFCVAVLAAIGAQFICERAGGLGPKIAAVLLTVGMVDAWIVGSPNYRYLYHYPPEHPRASQSFRQFWVQTPIMMTAIGQANMGSVNCEGFGYNVPRGSVLGYNEAGYRGEYFVLGAGSATQIEWSVNRLSFDVAASASSTLVVNQNFDPEWRLAEGRGTIVSERGMLAVQIAPGRQRVTFAYRPANIMLALILTLATLTALLTVWWWERERPCAG